MPLKILSLTEAATQRIKEILQNEPAQAGLSIGLKKGGCAEMEYDLKLFDSCPEHCDELKINDLRLFIPRDALLFLIGTEVDYEITPLRTGFIFNNPNQVSACGCGESVTLKPASL